MPEGCLKKNCLDCESHAIVGGKLDCNYMGRLGISQVTVKSFMPPSELEKSQTELGESEEQLEDLDKQVEIINDKRKALEAKKGGVP